MKALKTSNRRNVAVNLLLAVSVVVIFFGSLEVYSRYRYFNGTRLVDKGFTLRDGFVSLKKTTPVRMICIGGSTTYGYYAEKGESYPAYLGNIFDKRFGSCMIEVLNGGLPGKDTKFFKEYIGKKVGDQQVDIVTIDCFYNDFKAFFPFSYDPVNDTLLTNDNRGRIISTSYKWENFNLAEILNMWLTEHSYFYSRFREKLMLMRHRKKSLGEIYQQNAMRVKPKKQFIVGTPDVKSYDTSTREKAKNVIAMFMSDFRTNIETIISEFKSRNIDVVLVMAPYPNFKYTAWKGVVSTTSAPDTLYREIYSKARDALVEISSRRNILFIDNDEIMNKLGRGDDMFYDAVHLSPKGNRAVAENMAEKLAPYLKKKYNVVTYLQ